MVFSKNERLWTSLDPAAPRMGNRTSEPVFVSNYSCPCSFSYIYTLSLSVLFFIYMHFFLCIYAFLYSLHNSLHSFWRVIEQNVSVGLNTV